MSVEFVLLRKSLFAKGALVRSVSAVNPLVVLEVRTFDEAAIAESALIRPNARHTGIVVAFALFVAKDLTAHIAFVSFWVI